MRPTINIIGAGKVGQTIARLLVIRHSATIHGVCNTSIATTTTAIKFIGQGQPFVSIADLPAADITFITTPDDDIQSCCEILSQNPQLKSSSIVLHCCGGLSSHILHAVKNKNCLIASVHPMRSFTLPEISVKQYNGTYCAIEGDDAAITVLSSLFKSIGSNTYQVDSDKKSAYHAAGVFAANYLVTIYHNALLCLQEAGVENNINTEIIINLMQGTINNISKVKSPRRALTGPIERGDVNLIAQHLTALDENRQLCQLYKTLALSTLDIADLPTKIKEEIRALLS
ncbi:MAG: DUF2520 domain-containing protein [Gammaproteobacteria bacterium]|nr:DUF2520 domain-containing protein [Gammaproteobacteria bacterium]